MIRHARAARSVGRGDTRRASTPSLTALHRERITRGRFVRRQHTRHVGVRIQDEGVVGYEHREPTVTPLHTGPPCRLPVVNTNVLRVTIDQNLGGELRAYLPRNTAAVVKKITQCSSNAARCPRGLERFTLKGHWTMRIRLVRAATALAAIAALVAVLGAESKFH